MECIPTSYAPLIIHPDSEQEWTQHHVLSEQLHQAVAKQAPKSHPAAIQTRKQRPSQQQPSSRRSLLLHIPRPSHRVQKFITPTKPTKSSQEWEALLRTSMTNLQSTYVHMLQQAPPPPRRSLAALPDFSGLNRVQLASRAMQMAAGFGRRSEEDYDSESSGSEADVEAPATPMSVDCGEMMNIDPRLFS